MSEKDKNPYVYIEGTVLDLSDQAAQGVMADSNFVRDRGLRNLDLVLEMEQADFYVRGALLDAYDEIYDQEEDEEHEIEFIIGAALIHKCIRYQADLQGEECPLVDDISLKSLLTNIKLCKQNNVFYVTERAHNLYTTNPKILSTTYEYIDLYNKGIAGPQELACIGGSIATIDLLYQTVASERVVDEILYDPLKSN